MPAMIRHSMPARRRADAGFTLAEIAIVLVILAVLASVMLVPLGPRLEARQRAEAQATLEDVRAALIGFAIIHGRLPCPTTSTPPDGQESIAGTQCSDPTDEAFLPWRDLGIPPRDPWGNPWHYRADHGFADPASSPLRTDQDTLQNLIVKDHWNIDLTVTGENTATAIVYSRGANGTPDGQNASYEVGTTAVYEAGEPTTTFDDMVIWMGRPLLIARLAEAGTLSLPDDTP